MDVKLVMFKRDGRRRNFRLHKEKTIIGRGEDCTLRIPLPDVSRQHCELVMGEGELRARDLASSNGTYVNNKRVTETVLQAGDRLVIGPVVFTVQIDGAPEEITPAEAPAGTPAGQEPEVVELEADVLDMDSAEVEDSDPIAALEALAEETKPKKKEQ